jgi:hypothetical protein
MKTVRASVITKFNAKNTPSCPFLLKDFCLREKSPLSELVLTTFVHVVVKITALMLLWNINVLGSIDIFHLKKHFYLQKLEAR